MSATVYGYRTNNEVTPCFVTYHKSTDIDNDIKYNDHFITPSIFAWESRSNRRIQSKEIQNVINSKRILLFVKKEDAEGTDFYYLGDSSIIKDSVIQSKMPDSGSPVVHFKFELDVPVIDSVYNYLTKNNVISLDNKNRDQEKGDVATLNEVHINPNDESKNLIPFYDFYAAAGGFSEMQSNKDYELIEAPEKYQNDYFACKIMGESMNKTIPNGSICLFKRYTGGSRNGKIVLVENFDYQDPDFNSAFTIKTYSSEKLQNDEGWEHTSITLRPNSFDDNYKDIIIDPENSTETRVVGEYIMAL